MKTPTAPPPRDPAIALTLRAIIVLAIMAGFSMPPAAARAPAFKQGAPLVLAQQDDIGPGAASAAASAASGGRVLSVRRARSASGIVYTVKVLLPGGRMRYVTVNGLTGQVRG
ncbi:MAG: hypothetical protein ACI9DC_003068 [Gammaproteobacteria bacterium]|jgi:hypothetical protein